MRIELEPPDGAGPIRIGMPIEDAERLLEQLDGYAGSGNSAVPTPGFAYFESEMSIHAGPDRRGFVESVEVGRPDAASGDVVTYQDLDVFRTPADEVIRLLSSRTTLVIEDDGASVTAPELLLALWRPVVPENEDDEDGRYFMSALIARAGYYDLP